MAVYESLRDAECFAIFRVRRHMRRVWLGTCNREFAEEMEKAEIAVARVTNYKPPKNNRGRRCVWWVVYDYIWEHANANTPGGVKNMYEALCTPEAYLCMKLRRFFKWRRLYRITADDVLAYQAKRFRQGRSPCTVDHEIRALFRLLKWAKLNKQVCNIRKGLCRVAVIRNGSMAWIHARRDPIPPPRLVQRKPRKQNAPWPVPHPTPGSVAAVSGHKNESVTPLRPL